MKSRIKAAEDQLDININATPNVEATAGINKRSPKNLQYLFSKALHAKQGKDFLFKHKEAMDLARIHSCEGSVSGMWLYDAPSHDEFIMSPNLFRTNCLTRLGMSIPQIPHYCKCRKELIPMVTISSLALIG